MMLVASRTRHVLGRRAGAYCLRHLSSSDALRAKILDAAVKHVPALGWSDDALAMGAKDAGVSAAAHGQLTRGAVDLVEHVASACADDLHAEINARRAAPAPENPKKTVDARRRSARTSSPRRPASPRGSSSPSKRGGDRCLLFVCRDVPLEIYVNRLKLSLPYHEHRAQAMGLMATPSSESAFPPDIAAIPALGRVADELARATLVAGEPMDDRRWLWRRSAAAGSYAIAEIRALSDGSPDLGDTVAFSAAIVDRFGDALDTPDQMKDGLRAGAHAAASLGTAALSFLPGKAVGALPQLVMIMASRSAGGLAGLAEKGLSKLLKLLPPSPIPDPPKKPAPAEAPAAPEP